MSSAYDEDYFLRGKQSGKSLYEDYRWLPDLTIPMACAMVRHCGIANDDVILDFGCARGYTVKAFREMGYSAWGVDVSEWAIANADPDIREFVCRSKEQTFLSPKSYDWVIAKDVLEHIPEVQEAIHHLMRSARVGVFAVVPLSSGVDGYRYEVAEYEQDVTHIHRLTLPTWMRFFMQPGWAVEGRYRVKGVKDNYSQYRWGNGFITCRRINEQ